MAGYDDQSADAERRAVLLRQLPRRLRSLRRRGLRLARPDFDINALALLADDVVLLRDACRAHAVEPLAAQLGALSEALAAELDDPAQLAVERVCALGAHFDALSEPRGEVAPLPAASRRAAALDAIAPQTAQGVPLAIVPPAAFVARHAVPVVPVPVVVAGAPAVAVSATDSHVLIEGIDRELAAEALAPAPITAESVRPAPGPASAPAPAAAAPQAVAPQMATAAPAAAGRTVYVLSDGNPLVTELIQRLEAQGHQLELYDRAEELKEMVRALTPALVIVDAGYLDALEGIGQSVRTARARASQRLALLVLGPNGDVATRLRAMRAGADAFVTLPAAAADVAQRATELLSADAGEPFRVMIVEDDRSQALFAESILRKAGMETCTVTDPLSALDALEQFEPELILMDLYMPNCDGIELTALIREREQFINTPVVFLSGEHDADKRFDALSAGGDDYLEKPIRPKYLISAVTNRVRRARQLSRRVAQANPRDAVSGLYERGYLIERMANMLAADDGTGLGGVLFVIIDGAQAIRERIGLSAFDALLGQAGALLAGLIPGTDYATRYGDTSFVLLVQGKGKQALLAFGEEIRSRFEQHVFEVGERSMTLAVSIGISMFAQGFREPGEMLNAAERACAQARTATGPKVRLYETATLAAGNEAEAALLAAIRDALRYDRFQLWYQPIASLHGQHEPQFQALLRLRGDRGRLHTAAEILPVAARNGLLAQIDAWVLERVLALLQERDRLDQPVRLFVSQDVEALSDPRRLEGLVQQLRQRQIGAGSLVIELRMADIAARLREAAAFCAAARAAGVRICLNGFQAGPAASQLLQHVPVDYLKLEPRYASAGAALGEELRELVALAHDRGVKLITPLVEDAQSAARLWSIGLDYIQGDFVQQPAQDLDFDFSAAAV